MKKTLIKTLFLAILISPAFTTQAQSDTSYTHLSWKEKNFFTQWGLSAIFTELYLSPWFTVGDLNDQKNTYTSQNLTFTFVSVSYEPRLNLYHLSDIFSISLNSPLTVGLSITTDGESTGGLHVTIPALIHLNFFYHSTYNNINSRGFTFGMGGQYVLAPVIIPYAGSASFYPQAVASLGYKHVRKKGGVSYNLLFGFMNGTSVKFTFGKILNY